MLQHIDFGQFLGFVRRALEGVGNVSYTDFASAVLIKLAAGGVIETPPDMGYHNLHLSLQTRHPQIDRYLVQSFFYLLYNGYLMPMSNPPNAPTLTRCIVTDRGLEWVKSSEPMPEDVCSYIETLTRLIPYLDAIVQQYVEEALLTYERGAYFAAAVMLGAASEKIMYLLAAALEKALQNAAEKKRIAKALDGRTLLTLMREIGDALERHKRNLPHTIGDGLAAHLLSFSESIRAQRNDAVHPAIAKVSQDRVRLALAAFPHAASMVFALMTWLQSNTL